ncbi:MAG: redoxin family protein [Candidatus Pacebacteria bacterium]|nr:redoxin family protein [Candidatus Paceibacterota bacterium]
MVLLLVSFVAGVLTVLAPCILPVLPVVIGSSAAGKSKWTPYVVVGSLGLSVIAFTFLLKASTAFIAIPPEFWTYFAGAVFAIFGLTLVFPALWESIPGLAHVSTSSNKLLGAGYQKKSLWGDAIVGAALGPIFSTCSPTYFLILASVLPASYFLGTVYIVAYVLGLAAVLLPLALLGDRLAHRLSGYADPKGWFKRGLGVLFIVLGLLVGSGIIKQVETAILDAGYFDITKVEQRILQLAEPMMDAPTSDSGYPRYRDIVNPSGFVNSDPFTLADYVGKKVILVDFMTYSCINCQRTFPYLNEWHKAYEDEGLLIVGIHTPEFAFERDIENVRRAADKFGLEFPLVLDNEYATWAAYENRYWPRKYLIDIKGNIVYDHIGEGKYDETEAKIVELLNERKRMLGEEGTVSTHGASPVVETPQFQSVRTPETYLGSDRVQYLVNLPARTCLTGSCSYSYSGEKRQGYELAGQWITSKESIMLEQGQGGIQLPFSAKKVNLVAGSATPVSLEVYVDGVLHKRVVVGPHDLYNLVDMPFYGEHVVEIRFLDPGISAFAFTFG